jgi:UDP-2-acetamido-3-amino-2,3-dideoxy-glucuronate N-acetyltransferase
MNTPSSIVTPTLVCYGASIGANATLVCGVTVGRFAMVGAGAVVARDVPAHGLVLGSPARLVGYACPCGQRLPGGPAPAPAERRCSDCGRTTVVGG